MLALPALVHEAAGIAAQLADGGLHQRVTDQLAALEAPGAQVAGDAGPQQPPVSAGDTSALRPLLSASQLRCALDWQIVVLANLLLSQQQQGAPPPDGAISSGGKQAAAPAMQAPPVQVAVSAQQLEHARAAVDAAAQRLLQQEPGGPRCHYAAGLAALHPRAGSSSASDSFSDGSEPGGSAAEHFLRAAQLGLQQGSPVWAAAGAAAALQHVPAGPLAGQQSTARAAAEAVEKARAALQAGSKQLPNSWVHSLSACLDSTEGAGQPVKDGKGANGSTGTAATAAACGGASKPAKGAAAPAPLLLPHQRADPPGARRVAGERAQKQQIWLTVCVDTCLLFCLTVCCESFLGVCCEGCLNACCGACCGT
ncbi:hypothetical protein ABPG77_006974 [Micractinium sp. CCAP 211/92]